jgi:hypothetical protein
MLDKQLLSKDAHEYFKLQSCEELFYELHAHFKMNNVTFAPTTITFLKVIETTKVKKTTKNLFGIVTIDIEM